MKYRCSNGHLFHSFEPPEKCLKHGCNSRIIRPADGGEMPVAAPKSVAEGNFWTRILVVALAVLILAAGGLGFLLKKQSGKNAQLEQDLKAVQKDCKPLESQLNARKGSES